MIMYNIFYTLPQMNSSYNKSNKNIYNLYFSTYNDDKIKRTTT